MKNEIFRIEYNVNNISVMTEYVLNKIFNMEEVILFVNNKTNFLGCTNLENWKLNENKFIILLIDNDFDWFDFLECESCINLEKQSEEICNECIYDAIWEHLFFNYKTK